MYTENPCGLHAAETSCSFIDDGRMMMVSVMVGGLQFTNKRKRWNTGGGKACERCIDEKPSKAISAMGKLTNARICTHTQTDIRSRDEWEGSMARDFNEWIRGKRTRPQAHAFDFYFAIG